MIAMSNQMDHQQQELLNIIKAAHQNLAVARKVRESELRRRVSDEKRRIESEAQRDVEASAIRIREQLEYEVALHESALDESLIAAYNQGVPVRRIALDGFGNRYDGAVHAMLRSLRADNRVGNREGYQRNTEDRDLGVVTVEFPKPIDVEEILAEVTPMAGPRFVAASDMLVLVEAGPDGTGEVSVPAVILTLDARDSWFARIAKNGRPGTPYKHATHCTLYRHPFTRELLSHESKETGAMTWDHPVARWVIDNPTEAAEGFDSAVNVVSE
jgi:hypothetical protein